METYRKFCPDCGHEVKSDASFCPNCGSSIPQDELKSDKKSFEELVKEILWVKEGSGYRISKAKLVGVLFFLYVVLTSMIFIVPPTLRINFLGFVIAMFLAYVVGLVWYAVFRGVGFLVRKYLINSH